MKQDKIWDFFQNEHATVFDGSIDRLNFLVANIKKGTKVLNIGVGSGFLEKISVEKGVDIYSLDPNSESIKRLQVLLGENKAKVGYSQNIPFEDNIFDAVVMSEVLEHLDDDVIRETINEIHRVLKPSGDFMGTVPHKEDLFEQMVVCPNCGEKFHRWGHVQSFDIEKLEQTFSERFCGIDIKIKKFSSMDTRTTTGKVLSILGYLKYRILKIIGLNNLGESLYFICKKPSKVI